MNKISVRRTNSIWNFHRWIKIKLFLFLFLTFNLSRNFACCSIVRDESSFFRGKGYEMKVFVCEEKKFMHVKRESNIRCKKIHILLRKFEEKESIREHFKVKKNEDRRRSGSLKDRCAESRLFQGQNSSYQCLTMLFQRSRIIVTMLCYLFLNNIFFSMNFQKKSLKNI